ncbi:uncharacterized protein LOC116416772 [Nasonia vitripennis]|uniref:Reverse transcriptase domain-containing protein n=1 Tax=Nasonia vitripennis TaxID=7425 RepID=A0A7M7Q604_NASVI|nr:uncharacterized protein LOC116416772 [Nasonia vitripennis]
MEQQPHTKAIREGAFIVILLPQSDDETLGCLLCVGRGRYSGKTRVECLNRHVKEVHPDLTTTFRCWGCGFAAPGDKKYPRKIVTQHCATCVPEVSSAPSGRVDGERRVNTRRRLGIAAATEATPVRRTRRNGLASPPVEQNISQSAAPPEPARVPQHPEIVALGESADDEVFRSPVNSPPRDWRAAAPQQAASSSPLAVSGITAATPSNTTRTGNGSANSILAEHPIPTPPPTNTTEASGRADIPRSGRTPPPGQQAARRRAPTTEQRRIVGLLEAATGREQLEEATSLPNIQEAGTDFVELAARRDGGEDWPDVFDREEPTAASGEALCTPITREEVFRRLKGRNNTSPGPDGITYRDLAKADPGAHVLAALYNSIWRIEATPALWGVSNTTLIYKKGDAMDISNWRPISLGDTVPKLFAAILAYRIKRWAVANGRYSAYQKGFLEFEGCYEHNFVLQEAIREAKGGRKELVVAWLDLASAFTSVPHSSILQALEGHGLPSKARNIISSLYTGMTTRFHTAEGPTDPILIQSGVRQGCPLSPGVFNLTLEVVLREIQRTGEGYTIEGRRISHLAYADDVAILADSPAGMRRLLFAAERGARAVGLTFNPAKCATLHIAGRGEEAVRPTEFSVQGTPVRALASGEAYEHLGIPTGYQVRQTPINTLRDLLADIGSIDRSLLAPWQKLDAVGTFLLPRLDFIMQGAHIDKGFLTEADKIIKKAAKSWLSLPQRASAELVFLPPSQGGGGLLPLADLYDLLTVAHSYKMLYSSDVTVSTIAGSTLRRTVSERLKKRASNIDIARFLSGDLDLPRSTSPSTFWTKVRSAALRIKTKRAAL